jgi:hypothetical protein
MGLRAVTIAQHFHCAQPRAWRFASCKPASEPLYGENRHAEKLVDERSRAVVLHQQAQRRVQIKIALVYFQSREETDWQHLRH